MCNTHMHFAAKSGLYSSDTWEKHIFKHILLFSTHILRHMWLYYSVMLDISNSRLYSSYTSEKHIVKHILLFSTHILHHLICGCNMVWCEIWTQTQFSADNLLCCIFFYFFLVSMALAYFKYNKPDICINNITK